MSDSNKTVIGSIVDLDLSYLPTNNALKPEKSLKILYLEKMASLESKRLKNIPDKKNEEINNNVSKSLAMNTSSERKNSLKIIHANLKEIKVLLEQTSVESETEKQAKEIIIKAIVHLKECYQNESFDNNLKTKDLISNLLKCQYYKYKIIKENNNPTPPEMENDLLFQLKNNLSGAMLPIERIILWQIITFINEILSVISKKQQTILESKDTLSVLKERSEQLTENGKNIDLSGFDPIEANRQILQLKSKYNRTFSETEKKEINEKINNLEEKQKAHNLESLKVTLERNINTIKYNINYIEKSFSALSEQDKTNKIKQINQQFNQWLQILIRQINRSNDVAIFTNIINSSISQIEKVLEKGAVSFIAVESIKNNNILNQINNNILLKKELVEWSNNFNELIKKIYLKIHDISNIDTVFKLELYKAKKNDLNNLISETSELEEKYISDEKNSNLRENIVSKYLRIISVLPFT